MVKGLAFPENETRLFAFSHKLEKGDIDVNGWTLYDAVCLIIMVCRSFFTFMLDMMLLAFCRGTASLRDRSKLLFSGRNTTPPSKFVF